MIKALRWIFFECAPWVDFAVGGAAVWLASLLIHRVPAIESELTDLLSKDSAAVYGAILAAWASLLGFSAAILALVPALLSDARLELLSTADYIKFWNAFTLTIRVLGMAVVIELLALLLSRDSEWRFAIIAIVGFFVAASCVTLSRAAAGLELLLKFSRPPTDATENPNPHIVP